MSEGDMTEKKDGKRELTITVPSEKVEAALDQAYRKLAPQVVIPGFRKGKAPRGIFERHVGSAALYEEALPDLLPRAFEEAAVEAGLDPVGSPDFKMEDLADDRSLTFKALVHERPQAEPGDYQAIEVELHEAEVSEDEISERIEEIRKQAAQLVPVEGSGVKVGENHVVIMDMKVTVPGQEPQESQEATVDMSQDLLPGFKENILGETVGSVVEFTLSLPDDYGSEELAGRPASFRVFIKELKYRELPAVNDEFAQEHFGVETVDEMRETIERRLKAQQSLQILRQFEKQVLEALAEKTQVDIPEAMLEEEKDRLQERYAEMMGQENMAPEVAEQMRKSLDTLARANLTEMLGLEAVAREEGFEVTSEDWDEALDQATSGANPEERAEMVEHLSSGLAKKAMEREILRKKAFEKVASLADEKYPEVLKKVSEEFASLAQAQEAPSVEEPDEEVNS